MAKLKLQTRSNFTETSPKIERQVFKDKVANIKAQKKEKAF